MLDNNSKTLSTNGKRPPLRLKKIFCPSMHHRTSKDSHIQEMAISPPLMSPPQPMIHSNNRIYSLVSPTRPTHPSLFMGSGGDNDHDDSDNNQNKRPPVLNSVPPRVSSMPKHRVPRRSTIGTPSNISLHQNKTSMASPPEPPKKSPSRPSRLPRPSVSSRATAPPPPPPSSKKSSGVSSGAGDRRHSFHVPPLQQSSSLLSSINSASVSSISAEQGHSRLAELASNSSKSASTSSTTLASFSSSSSSSSSTKKKKRNRQSRAAAAATMPPPQPTLQKSRSTPLRRIKAYNVDYDQQSQMERKRKQRELEELIAGGRRGSTLKLSLTPRGL